MLLFVVVLLIWVIFLHLSSFLLILIFSTFTIIILRIRRQAQLIIKITPYDLLNQHVINRRCDVRVHPDVL